MPQLRLTLLLAAIAAMAPASLAYAQDLAPAPYSITDLGPAAGCNESTALGLNSSGQVVGFSTGSGSNPYIKAPTLWTHGSPLAIPRIAGASAPYYYHETANAVNNSGWVVGSYTNAQDAHAFLWTPASGTQNIGVFPGGYDSRATGINSSGVVVGTADNPNVNGQNRAFLWTPTQGMQDLGALNGMGSSMASAINSTNQVVGTSVTLDQDLHAFLWSSAKGMQDLGVESGDSYSEATGINDSGQVIVNSNGGAQYLDHAFLWSAAHGVQDLGSLGAGHTFARGINAAGQVVGGSALGGSSVEHAFLWDAARGMRDLNRFIAAPGWELTEARAINASGQIAGTGRINGAQHAFLLTPVPAVSLTLTPSSVVNGHSSSALISLNGYATTGANPLNGGAIGPGVYVRLTSSKSDATFSGNVNVAPDGQTYIYIPQGQWQATFTINAGIVDADTVASINASFAGGSRSANLTITAAQVQSIVLSPPLVVNGSQSIGTVTLTAPAYRGIEPSGHLVNGAFVKLTSSTPLAIIGGNVFMGPDGNFYAYIPQGQTQATFTIDTGLVTASTSARITAAIGAVAKTANLTITPILVQSVVLNPTSVLNGGQSTGTVTLATPAPMNGAFAKLSSSSSAATFGDGLFIGADGSASVYIPQGQTQATFIVDTGSVATSTSVKITASINSSVKTAYLTITPTLVQSVVLSPASVVNGGQSTGTVTLATPAFMAVAPFSPLGPGAYVKLTSSSGIVTFSGNIIIGPDGAPYVYIPQGQTQASFTVNTIAVPAPITIGITAFLGAVSKTASLRITPTVLQSLVLAPSTVGGGAQTTATLTLASPSYQTVDVHAGYVPGLYVKLSSSNAAAVFGSDVFLDADGNIIVFIPQGHTQATFTVNTSHVAARTSAVITATLNGSARSAGLTITP